MGFEIFISGVLLLVGIAVLVTIHVCIVNRAFGSNNGDGNNVVVQRSMKRSSSMSQDDIKKLPIFDFMVEENNSSSPVGGGGILDLDCAVCLENFKVGEKCRLLPNCKHSFHADCIDSWLLKIALCPICRTETFSQTVGGHDRNQIDELV